jgi:broad specificity phosphatase PhoE
MSQLFYERGRGDDLSFHCRTAFGDPPDILTDAQLDPAYLVQAAINTESVVAFGQRPAVLSSRRRRTRTTAPEQTSLFSFN